jgi:sterol desaturase/sphingolipid hydroxylase (fatty acid hydroxylase superfamily)
MLQEAWNYLKYYVGEYELLTIGGVFFFFVLLERVLAQRESALLRRGWFQDAVYMLVNPMFIKEGIIGAAFIIGLGPLLKSIMPMPVREFVHGLPLWAGIPLATLIADLGFYTAHRMFHTVPWLWPFHAVHHSSEHMDALAAVRVHPVDQIVTKLFSLLPLMALDFNNGAIIGFSMIYLVQSFWVHSNVRGFLGPLRLAVATPEFHHWHHADHKEAYDKNFAGQLPLWDLIFGTYQLPARAFPTKYGLSEPIPQGYFRQLAYPFVKLVSGRRKEPARVSPAPVPTAPDAPPATLGLEPSSARND